MQVCCRNAPEGLSDVPHIADFMRHRDLVCKAALKPVTFFVALGPVEVRE